jgi:predicted MFS family arabinose efflux permease
MPREDLGSVNRTLRSLAAFYFFNYGALGALFPFLPLLLATRGLSAAQISWVMVLIPVFNLLMPPLWGSVADALHARVALLRLASVGSGLTALLLLPPSSFRGSLLAVACFSVFRSPVASLADAATYAALDPREAGFGRVRVWGSVGYAIFVGAVGLFDGSRRPALLLAVASAGYLLSGLATLALPSPRIRREPGILRDVGRCVAHPAVVLFLAGTTCYYFGHAIYDAYFSLYVRWLGLSDAFVGAAWALGVAVEVAIMLFAPSVLRARSSSSLLCACSGIAALRWGLLSLASGRWAILGVQTLHGLTFGLWYLSLVEHVQMTAPARLRTSLQAVALASLGLGSVAGYLLGGHVFHHLGGGQVFRVAAGGSVAALLCYLAVGHRRLGSP